MEDALIDVRFATALQLVLALALASERGRLCTSGELAEGVGANPALVRKLLRPLARNGVVIASMGKNGGVRLARSPEAITLLDVYRSAVEGKRLFLGRSDVPGRCVVGRNIETFFLSLTDEAEERIAELLASRTVAQSLQAMRASEDAPLAEALAG